MKRPLEFDSLEALLAYQAESRAPWIVRPEDPIRSDRATITTFDAVLDGALLYANRLSSHYSSGTPLLLVLENGPTFALAFFGALLAGMIPTPLPPPNFAAGRSSDYRSRLERVVRDCRPEVLLVNDDPCRKAVGELPGVHVLTLGELAAKSGSAASPRRSRATDTAVIQYTSGSTGHPRGVELSHGNLLANVEAIGIGTNVSPADVGVAWLPLFHDMGLIGSLLFSLGARMKYVMLTPREFMMRPASWLWAVSRFRATLSPAPNFGFRLCTSRVKEEALAGLDLSRWRIALNGAEAVDHTTVHDFVTRLAPYGLRPDVVWPVYGLAENALAVTFPAASTPFVVDRVNRSALEQQGVATGPDGTESSREIVSVGSPLPGQRVRITRGTAPVAERCVGDVEVTGPSVMKGYFGDPEGSRDAITKDGWLRTGDRGYLAESRLYLTGRSKDVIKRHGRALDAADVERGAVEAPGIQDGRVVAFGIEEPGEGEHLVVAVELPPMTEDAQRTVRSALAEAVVRACDARPDRIVFVKPGALPRTTSGKVRRSEARTLYLGGVLERSRTLSGVESRA